MLLSPRSPEEKQGSAVPRAPRRDLSPDDQEDRDLMVRVRQGDNDACAALMGKYGRPLRRYLQQWVVHHPSEIDDVYQETWIKVFSAAPSYDLQKRFQPWLYTIAEHSAIDCLRRTRRRAMVSLDALHSSDEDGDCIMLDRLVDHRVGPPDARLIGAEEREKEYECLRARLDTLTQINREILLLIVVRGLQYAEAAEVLQIPVGTVKSRLFSARRRLCFR